MNRETCYLWQRQGLEKLDISATLFYDVTNRCSSYFYAIKTCLEEDLLSDGN